MSHIYEQKENISTNFMCSTHPNKNVMFIYPQNDKSNKFLRLLCFECIKQLDPAEKDIPIDLGDFQEQLKTSIENFNKTQLNLEQTLVNAKLNQMISDNQESEKTIQHVEIIIRFLENFKKLIKTQLTEKQDWTPQNSQQILEKDLEKLKASTQLEETQYILSQIAQYNYQDSEKLKFSCQKILKIEDTFSENELQFKDSCKFMLEKILIFATEQNSKLEPVSLLEKAIVKEFVNCEKQEVNSKGFDEEMAKLRELLQREIFMNKESEQKILQLEQIIQDNDATTANEIGNLLETNEKQNKELDALIIEIANLQKIPIQQVEVPSRLERNIDREVKKAGNSIKKFLKKL